MDGRVDRLWYLPTGWQEPRSVQDYLRAPSSLKNSTSLPDSREQTDLWDTIRKSPCIFLSRSPLTFGHSQLLIPYDGDSEQDLFRLASEIICKAISALSAMFSGDKPPHQEEIFEPLAKMTLTGGHYVKTLVLRASANESSNEYKVHLVPYFKSHKELCRKRFHSLHAVAPDKEGGLLGWLGEREDVVDNWEVDPSPVQSALDHIANEHLKMSELAKRLHVSWREA